MCTDFMLEEPENLTGLLKDWTLSALLQQRLSGEMMNHCGFLAAPRNTDVSTSLWNNCVI